MMEQEVEVEDSLHLTASPERVADAIARVDRRRFLPPHFIEVAYRDEPVMVEDGVTMPPRCLVQLTTELLELTLFDTVLEIGTGSGYQTNVLALLCREVHSLDIRPLQHRIAHLLPANVILYKRNGIYGVPEEEPLDAILVSCATPAPLKMWADQLAEGGRLVMPVGDHTRQRLVKYVKQDGVLRDRGDFAYVRFVPLVI